MELKKLLNILDTEQFIEGGSVVNKAMVAVSNETRRQFALLNSGVYDNEEIRAQMSEITGAELDESFSLFVPFTADFGKNIKIGKNVFINSGCRFQDQGGITIGDGSLVGHNVVLATINHDLNPNNRGSMFLAPIELKKNTWIGSQATILSGITIGENSVVAAGSVVTKDVPANTVVAGNPARIVKEINS